MKCDELKPLIFSIADLAYVDEIRVIKNFQNPHDHAVYKATEVDAAIAELKDIIKNNQSAYYVDLGIVANDCEKLKAENRRLKRALWLARANKAESEARGWYHSNAYIISYDGLHSIKGVLNGKGFKRYPNKWMELWIKIERLCRAKAEEYK